MMIIHWKRPIKKILSKEGSLKRYQDRTKQYRQNRTFQTDERKILLTRGE